MTSIELSPAIDSLPWLSVGPGFDLKLVRGAITEADACVELLRLQPGSIVSRHRHTGEIHAWHLSGQRKLLDTGEILGPGSYLYEPAGNVDSWMAVGDEPLIAIAIVRGAIEYLDDTGAVTKRSTPESLTERYAALVARAA